MWFHSIIVPLKHTVFKLLHSEKAFESILVTLFGIVTLIRLLQFEKAYDPILVTVFPAIVVGITTSVSEPL